MRTDPALVTFIEDLPNLEPAARGMLWTTAFDDKYSSIHLVSVQTISQSVNALVSGLNQVQAEITLKQAESSTPGDHFVRVMQVIYFDHLVK